MQIHKAPPTAQGKWVSAYDKRKDFDYENHPGHPYLYSFLLVFSLTLICALLAGSSYRSEREKQEAAEQRRIQELHNEFLAQKDKAAADHMVSIKNDMQDRLRQATFEDLLVLFTPCTRL